MVFGSETEVPLGQPLSSASGVSHGSGTNLNLSSHGDENTTEYRIKAADKSGKKTISLWHDVTLVHVDPATDRPTPYLNFVCEIPKFSRKKYEIATDEVGNFIKQDEKKGVLREFKKGDIFFNYGCLPVSSNMCTCSKVCHRIDFLHGLYAHFFLCL